MYVVIVADSLNKVPAFAPWLCHSLTSVDCRWQLYPSVSKLTWGVIGTGVMLPTTWAPNMTFLSCEASPRVASGVTLRPCVAVLPLAGRALSCSVVVRCVVLRWFCGATSH